MSIEPLCKVVFTRRRLWIFASFPASGSHVVSEPLLCYYPPPPLLRHDQEEEVEVKVEAGAEIIKAPGSDPSDSKGKLLEPHVTMLPDRNEKLCDQGMKSRSR